MDNNVTQTEQQKFQDWSTQEKANGLIDFKLFAGSLGEDQGLEDVFKELNEINEILAQPAGPQRTDVF